MPKYFKSQTTYFFTVIMAFITWATYIGKIDNSTIGLVLGALIGAVWGYKWRKAEGNNGHTKPDS